MRAMLEAKKRDLEAEFGKGQRMLAQHRSAVEQVQATMLRVQGAIAVLDELLAAAPKAEAAAE